MHRESRLAKYRVWQFLLPQAISLRGGLPGMYGHLIFRDSLHLSGEESLGQIIRLTICQALGFSRLPSSWEPMTATDDLDLFFHACQIRVRMSIVALVI